MIRKHIYKTRAEWLKARTSFIGGSDASCIVGMNPYKNNIDLWEEKIGMRLPEDISDKPYVKYGNEAEPLLRELFKLDHPGFYVWYEEGNMFTNDRYPFAHASLDGLFIDDDNRCGILEIKTTEILQSMQKEKWKDRIPDNYYIQCLHYLAVTEVDYVILKAQLKSMINGHPYLQTKEYVIEREEVLEDIEYLMRAEERFAYQIKNGIRPNLVLPNI